MDCTSTSSSQATARRKVTKQDVFKEPTVDETASQPLTASDLARYTKELTAHSSPHYKVSEPADRSQSKADGSSVQVVGCFDELTGVVTPAAAKSLEKRAGSKVKLVSLEEATRQIEAEKTVFLTNMPEDALMVEHNAQQTKPGGINLSNHTSDSVFHLEVDGSDYQTSATTNEDHSFECARGT